MKTLTSLMREFAILGMEPEPLEGETGLEFDPQGATVAEPEYELDAEGNPVLDADGNPVPKLPAVPGAVDAAPACACDHAEAGVAAAAPGAMGAVPPMGALPPAPGAVPPMGDPAAMPMGSPPPPADEFDFKF